MVHNGLKIASTLALAMTAGLWGCSSPEQEAAEEAREQKAEQIEQQGEMAQEQAEQKAEQVREQPAQPAAATAEGAVAVAKMNPTQGSQVSGTVTFTKTAKGAQVVAELMGLTPGEHGFHIHEKGDCSAPDAKSAGAHFNPGGHQHGGPNDTERHVGDMGNITADQQGNARLEMALEGVQFEGEAGIVGKSVIVHAKPDDLKSQPSGDAGDRLACGVIELQK